MFSKVSAVAFFAGIAAAYHAPVGDPSGNPITRPLNEVVKACSPFTITWQPTTYNTVSILLLKGPSTNVVPIGAPIAEGISNSGSFVWTPPSGLDSTNGAANGYGIQLIDDVTGQYQYSTQFGIDNSLCVSSSSSVASSTSAGGYGTPSSSKAASTSASSSKVSSSTISSVSKANATSVAVPTSVYVAATGGAGYNSTAIKPTGSLTVPASLKTTAAGPTGTGSVTGTGSIPQFTGAASNVRAAFGLVAGVAGLAFML